MTRDKLYFCDGYACDEYKKKVCYTNGGECHHTLHIEHALSKLYKDFPPTKFLSVPTSSIRVEHFDEDKIFDKIKRGNMIYIKSNNNMPLPLGEGV